MIYRLDCGMPAKQWTRAGPNDESASCLIKQITSEKSMLVTKKLIRASNAHTTRDVDRMDGDLPNGWAWVLVDQITSIATVGFQPAGPYLTATPNNRYSFHFCIADRSPSDLFGRKQRLMTLLPPDESDGERSICELFALVADRCCSAG